MPGQTRQHINCRRRVSFALAGGKPSARVPAMVAARLASLRRRGIFRKSILLPRKPRHTLRLAAIAIATGTILLAGCGDQKSKAEEVRPVRTVVVDPKPIEDDRQATAAAAPDGLVAA